MDLFLEFDKLDQDQDFRLRDRGSISTVCNL